MNANEIDTLADLAQDISNAVMRLQKLLDAMGLELFEGHWLDPRPDGREPVSGVLLEISQEQALATHAKTEELATALLRARPKP